jgi:hypothetical protein
VIPYVRLAIAAGALAGAAYGGWWVRDAAAAKADLAREQAAAKAAARQAEIALRASQQYEVDREHIRARLRASQADLARALAASSPQCPGVEVGRIVLPAAALDGLRRAAGQDSAGDAGESRPPVSDGTGDPSR